MWDANDDANCKSPWFIWEAIDTSDYSIYSDVRVCFSCDYATWAAGHTMNDTPLATHAYWKVDLSEIDDGSSYSNAFSGQLVRAVQYGDMYGSGEYGVYGLHYKRTATGEHFPQWDSRSLPTWDYLTSAYLCYNSGTCAYDASSVGSYTAMDNYHHRVSVDVSS